jgi:hypothetical protein
MDELERLLLVVLGLNWEQSSAVLGDDASVAKLPDVADCR